MSETGEIQPAGREMTRAELWHSRFMHWLWRTRRKLPYLVWHGDELDVQVRWREDRLPADGDMQAAMRAFYSGPLREIETAMRKAGVSFDSGLGFGGRDWEWDFSLQGPISVTFKSRATRPERRRARPRPRLAIDNDPRPAA